MVKSAFFVMQISSVSPFFATDFLIPPAKWCLGEPVCSFLLGCVHRNWQTFTYSHGFCRYFTLHSENEIAFRCGRDMSFKAVFAGSQLWFCHPYTLLDANDKKPVSKYISTEMTARSSISFACLMTSKTTKPGETHSFVQAISPWRCWMPHRKDRNITER